MCLALIVEFRASGLACACASVLSEVLKAVSHSEIAKELHCHKLTWPRVLFAFVGDSLHLVYVCLSFCVNGTRRHSVNRLGVSRLPPSTPASSAMPLLNKVEDPNKALVHAHAKSRGLGPTTSEVGESSLGETRQFLRTFSGFYAGKHTARLVSIRSMQQFSV